MRSGALVAIIGVWLLLRTTRKDHEDKNLVDRLLGSGGGDDVDTGAGAGSVAGSPNPSTPARSDDSDLRGRIPSRRTGPKVPVVR